LLQCNTTRTASIGLVARNAGYYPGRLIYVRRKQGGGRGFVQGLGLNLRGRLWGMLGLGDLTISITGSGGQTL
jgi:hypothetical protein